MLGSVECVKLGYTNYKLIGYKLGVDDEDTFGTYQGVELSSSYVSFAGSNKVLPKGSLLGSTLRYNF